MSAKEIVSNRKAYHNYEIAEVFEAGIVLKGTEIKSIRSNGASLTDAYVLISKGEAWLQGMHIPVYKFGNIYNHEEKRPRKLLLHRYEIEKISGKLTQKGIAVVPLALLLKNGYVKVRIGCAKGKKLHDKRRSIMERETKRELDAAIKRRYN